MFGCVKHREGLLRSLGEVATSKEFDLVYGGGMGALGATTVYNSFRFGAPLSIVYLLAGVSLLSVVPFFVIRRPAGRTGDAAAHIVAFASFLSPTLLLVSVNLSEDIFTFPGVGLAIYAAGLVLYFASLFHLGRNFGILPAVRGVSSRGPYAFIRHPMYLGELLEATAICVIWVSYLNLIMLGVISTLLAARILLEEKTLLKEQEYHAYMKRTPYRLIPKIW